MKMRKGSLFDLLILLVLGFGILCGVGRFFEARAEGGEESTARITVRVTSTEADLSALVAVGEEVFLASGERFGEILDVSVQPARVELEHGGEILTGTWEGDERWDAEVTVAVAGSIGENGFLRDGRHALLVGQGCSLYTERAYIYGTVSAVSLAMSE